MKDKEVFKYKIELNVIIKHSGNVTYTLNTFGMLYKNGAYRMTESVFEINQERTSIYC